MAWVKLESRYSTHPKMLAAGIEGLALDISGLCYCREYSTGGFVPEAAIHALGPKQKNPEAVANRLVEVGRWERDDKLHGWWVHDFLAYNPTVDEQDQAALERSEKGRKAAEVRWAKVKPKQSKRKSRADAQALPGASDDDAAKHPPADAPHPSLPASDEVNSGDTQPVLPNGSGGPFDDSHRNGTPHATSWLAAQLGASA